jgi:hypothetical protein
MKREQEDHSNAMEAEDEILNHRNNMIVYRDPQDVRTIFQLLSLLLVFLSLLVMSAAGNAYQYWRRPDRIVVDRSNGRVLMINDRQFGETESVKMTPDVPNNEDKNMSSRNMSVPCMPSIPPFGPRKSKRHWR